MYTLLIEFVSAIPVFYTVILVIFALIALYLARKPFHRSIKIFGRVIYRTMRLSSVSVRLAEKRLQIRNRDVLLNTELDLAERKTEGELERLSHVVQKDLAGYPQIQRKISEELQKIEEDYKNSMEIPQSLPDWVKVIDAIANIKPSGDRMVVNMLEEIHQTLEEQHKTAVEHHRRDVAKRHNLLSRMMPVWRSMQKTLQGVQKTVANLNQRSKKIDRYMDDYEKFLTQKDMAQRQLNSSSLTRFFVSGLVLAIATVGVIVNFQLLSLPMSEMFGGANYIGTFKASDVAGMFIVCFEIALGVFLMDALHITRFFSIIGSMDDRKRKMIFWSLFFLLTILAGMESSLAFWRDRVAADMEALKQTLNGKDITSIPHSRIPMIGQMFMGFILPYIMTIVTIPFESFISALRTVLGMLASWCLLFLSFLLRLTGNFGLIFAKVLIALYDLIIFPALWLEGVVISGLNKVSSAKITSVQSSKEKKSSLEKSSIIDGSARYEDSPME